MRRQAAARWATLFFSGLISLVSVTHAQDPDTNGPLSQTEIETLRDSAYIPVDRIKAYQHILEDREKAIDALLARRQQVGYGQDLHDLLEQFAAIADELNDNLDEYAKTHRDVRKALPKLIGASERWSTLIRSTGEADAYKVVRRIALDTLKDTRELAANLQTEEDTYFKEHPDAAKAEKLRTENPHAPQ